MGDLDLRKIKAIGKAKTMGKLRLNWESPFIIVKVLQYGSYHPQDQERKVLPYAWNVKHLKLYIM